MKHNILVTGSLAFDRIAVFPDRFANHILKGHVHSLNVSFVVNDMQVYEGGTAGNIAYNLCLLGVRPILVAPVGNDASAYMARLKQAGVEVSYIKKYPRLLTATATIMTDLDDNQIASFYAGAMQKANQAKISSVKELISLAVIAPNDPKAMLSYSETCFKKGIPFIADPGQALPRFSSDELKDFVTGAHMLVLNDYEWELFQNKTGWAMSDILEKVNFLIVTYGSEGSKIWARGADTIRISSYRPKKLVDPTGCGDAYRAGLLYGYQQGYDVETSAHLGSWLAAKCIEKKGTQNHHITKTDLKTFLKTL